MFFNSTQLLLIILILTLSIFFIIQNITFFSIINKNICNKASNYIQNIIKYNSKNLTTSENINSESIYSEYNSFNLVKSDYNYPLPINSEINTFPLVNSENYPLPINSEINTFPLVNSENYPLPINSEINTFPLVNSENYPLPINSEINTFPLVNSENYPLPINSEINTFPLVNSENTPKLITYNYPSIRSTIINNKNDPIPIDSEYIYYSECLKNKNFSDNDDSNNIIKNNFKCIFEKIINQSFELENYLNNCDDNNRDKIIKGFLHINNLLSQNIWFYNNSYLQKMNKFYSEQYDNWFNVEWNYNKCINIAKLLKNMRIKLNNYVNQTKPILL